MADSVVGVKLTADVSGAVTNVKNFKQELRLATEQVVEMNAKFGATSKEAAAAAQKAAQLKDAIGDAKSLVDAFNPDTKFRAFGATINTVVGGFTALQGVMGLIGVESEETQKALLKVQSALAISQGFSQLQEGVQTFKNLGAVIQATTIFKKADNVVTAIATTLMRLFSGSTVAAAGSMRILKVAIAATGIGLLVIALVAAADALGFFSDKSEEAADSQEKLKNQIEGVNESLAAQGVFFSNEEKLEIAKAKRRGASEAEVFAIQEKYRHLNYEATLAAYEKVKGLDEVEAAKLRKQLDAQNIAGQVAQIDFETKETERRLAAAKDLQDKLKKQRDDARKQEIADALEEIKRKNAGFTGAGTGTDAIKTPEQLQLELDIAARAENRRDLAAYIEYSTESYRLFTEIHGRNVAERIANEQAEFDLKLELASRTGDILDGLSNLVGKQTAAGKILALASIAQGTAVAFIQGLDIAQKSAKGTGPGAAFAFPIFYATQIAAILAAVAKAKSALGGGGPNVSSPALVTAPLTPQKPQTQTTSLDQNSLNAIGNATTRAFVIESDITNNQEKVRRLNRQARLGG